MPPTVTVTDRQGDIVLCGPHMTTATFAGIKASMKPEDQERVIGWIHTGR